MSDDAHGHTTLIIKKHGGHHDEHHGGVWKIAFADFMTAMMAFFLVMWLVSANDKTKAVIAKYFNPIELVDSTPAPRGLLDSKKEDPSVDRKPDDVPDPAAIQSKEGQEGKQPKSADPKQDAKEIKEAKEAKEKINTAGGAPPTDGTTHPLDQKKQDDADASAKHQEMELLHDPYAVVAEIADQKSAEPPKQSGPPSAQPSGGSGAVGLGSGEAYRDPFEPQVLPPGGNPLSSVTLPVSAPPSSTMPAPPPAALAEAGAVPPPPPALPSPVSSPAPVAGTPAGAAPSMLAKPEPGAEKSMPATEAAQATPGSAQPATDAMAKPSMDADAQPGHGEDKPLSPAALKAKLAGLVQAIEGATATGGPKLEVRRTGEGTLISLTDSANFSMFAIASARPSKQAVALMARIGRVLRAQKGGITIRGFTDSRPFRSDTYDNWRLSTERAHIAQVMLARGGLEDARLDRIEGYADRRPKIVKDPENAENRRIEILLRDVTP